MTKDKKPKEEKVETSETETPQCLPNINDIIDNVKKCLPDHINISPKEKEQELCEVHIVGTPEMIQKILKIE